MKKHTLTLDIDLEDESPLLDDIAILFFQTDTPNYLFADDLNHLYCLALARIDDIALCDASWPLYTYHDQLRLLKYYLVDFSIPQPNNPIKQSKILIIRGEDAVNEANQIIRDFNEPPAVDIDPHNPVFLHRNDILLSYQQLLTSVTSYNPQSPAPSSRKAAKERQDLDSLLTSLLDHLDLNHL